MAYKYAKLTKKIKEARSFTATVTKTSAFPANEEFAFIMKDQDDAIVTSGDAIKTNSDKSVTFTIPYTDTVGLLGEYVVYLYYTDTNNVDIKADIREYSIIIEDDKA